MDIRSSHGGEPSDMVTKPSRQRLTHVDGLRGVAAMVVLVGHYLEWLAQARPDWTWIMAVNREDFSLGRLGVVAFFCVSGFVIPFSFSGATPLRHFLISRFFRLYPAYWFSLLAGAIILPAVGFAHFTPAQLLANVTMVQKVLHQKDVLGVYWTLFIELIFYVICFFAFAGRQLHSPTFNFGAMIVFSCVAVAGGLYRYTHPASHLSIGIFTYLAAMHFGTLLRIVVLERREDRSQLVRVALAFLVGATLVGNTAGYIHATDKTTGWIASSTSYLVALALFLGCIKYQWFSGRVPFALGRISYSMYLLHPIFMVLGGLVIANGAPGIATSIIVLVAGTLLASWASFNLIERPMQRLGKRLIDRMRVERT